MTEWTKERHDEARRLCVEEHDDASVIAEELPAALDHIEELERRIEKLRTEAWAQNDINNDQRRYNVIQKKTEKDLLERIANMESWIKEARADLNAGVLPKDVWKMLGRALRNVPKKAPDDGER